ncbi:MAG: hypothetical protein KTR31_33725 [Myxococcales bacterium]|nr:hypothetical protein [Myxococcales bacterium]
MRSLMLLLSFGACGGVDRGFSPAPVLCGADNSVETTATDLTVAGTLPQDEVDTWLAERDVDYAVSETGQTLHWHVVGGLRDAPILEGTAYCTEGGEPASERATSIPVWVQIEGDGWLFDSTAAVLEITETQVRLANSTVGQEASSGALEWKVWPGEAAVDARRACLDGAPEGEFTDVLTLRGSGNSRAVVNMSWIVDAMCTAPGLGAYSAGLYSGFDQGPAL